jgi:hypothetical protein
MNKISLVEKNKEVVDLGKEFVSIPLGYDLNSSGISRQFTEQ